MPVEYEGIRREHLRVRRAAGLFDVSHMGQVETRGPDAERLLQRVLSNDVSRIAEGGAQYSVLCREDGGVLDDLFTYRLAPDRYLTVTNAANHARDYAWIADHARDLDVEVRDGVARGTSGALAGSTLTMIDAVRNLHGLGVPLEDAVGAATEVPARVLRLPSAGRIALGLPADVVVLSDELEVERVLVEGRARVVG
jgi:aminomethyltransferase